MLFRWKLKLFVVLCLLFFFILPVHAYDDIITHPMLARKSIELFNEAFDNKISSSEEIGWIMQGAIEEDTPLRWMNHFYNPKTGSGLFLYSSAKDWSGQNIRQLSYPEGNQTWQKAIDSYANDNKKEAYIALGHILHLIEDMSVPAHTRDDIHPLGDPLEDWARNNADGKISNINIIKFNGLLEFFDNLAFYSNTNFLSEDTIDKNQLSNNEKYFKKIGEDDYVECLKATLDSKNFCLAVVRKSFTDERYILDDTVHSDYYSLLAPKAVSYGAGVIGLFFEEAEKKKQEEKNSFFDKIKLWFGEDDYSEDRPEVQMASDENGEILPAVAEDESGETIIDDQNNPTSEKTEAAKKESEQDKKAQNTPIGVKRVIDGDTIELTDGQIVRYIGVDTPELGNPGPADDECLAWVATLRNVELLGRGNLKLIKDPAVDKDKYGRLLRYVYSGDLFVNKQLALDGLAVTFFCQPGWKNCPLTTDKERETQITAANNDAVRKKRALYSGVCDQKKEEELSPTNKEVIKAKEGELSKKINSQKNEFIWGGNSDLSESEKDKEDSDPFISFSLKDLSTGNIKKTSSSTVAVNYEIKNDESITGYLLSNSSTTPEKDDKLWSLSKPAIWTLEEGAGEKKVYFWIKYGDENKIKFMVEMILFEPIIEILNFKLISLTSASEKFTASTTVELDYDIKNAIAGTKYFLSNTNECAEDDEGWISEKPAFYVLPTGDGEKSVYFCAKSESDEITGPKSASIFLDTVAPSTPEITNLTEQAGKYWVNKNEVSLLGTKEKFTNRLFLDGVEYSATSTDEIWNLNYDFNFECPDLNDSNITQCLLDTGYSGVWEGDLVAAYTRSLHKKRLEFKAIDEAGNTSEPIVKEFSLDPKTPSLMIGSIKTVTSRFLYLIVLDDEQHPVNKMYNNSGVGKIYTQYKTESDWIDIDNIKLDEPFMVDGMQIEYKISLPGEGEYQVRLKGEDLAGNISDWWVIGGKAKVKYYPVISEIYGGGGNSGSYWKNDFIELYNPTNISISLDGWSVQYASAKTSDWNITPLSGSIAPGGYYLISEKEGSGGTSDLPLSDALGLINMNATDGKIALVNNLEGITGQSDVNVIDFIGYGAANEVEGGARIEIEPSNEKSLERKAFFDSESEDMRSGGIYEFNGNGIDSNQNKYDFILRMIPEPQNSALVELPIEK